MVLIKNLYLGNETVQFQNLHELCDSVEVVVQFFDEIICKMSNQTCTVCTKFQTKLHLITNTHTM